MGTSFPASPSEGDLLYRSDEHKLYIYNGSTWKLLIAPANITEITTRNHNDLQNIGASDHHAKTTSAGEITSGRFVMARMPDGTDGYFLKAKGSGVDPEYAPSGAMSSTEVMLWAMIFGG